MTLVSRPTLCKCFGQKVLVRCWSNGDQARNLWLNHGTPISLVVLGRALMLWTPLDSSVFGEKTASSLNRRRTRYLQLAARVPLRCAECSEQH